MLIDSHCHIFPPRFIGQRRQLLDRDATLAALFARQRAPMADAEALIDAMDREEVSRAVVMGLGWTDLELAREANEYVVEAVSRYPQRLIGFCSVNPAWGDRAAAEAARWAEAGCRGIGELHPDTQGFDITSKAQLEPLMDAARRLGLPVLVHGSEPVGHSYPGKGGTTPDRLYRFIQNFPDNLIVCAHWGGGLPFYALMPEVSQALHNVYFDTAASVFLYGPGVVPTVIGLVGSDKILFGSDFPLVRPRRIVSQIESAAVDPAAQRAILGGNVSALLGL